MVPSYFTAAFGIEGPASSCSSLGVSDWAIVHEVPVLAALKAPPVAFYICMGASTNYGYPGLERGATHIQLVLC